jgi:hypothetical protein
MSDNSFISDVRSSKQWVHSHTGGFARLLEHLTQVEREFVERKGMFAGVPRTRPAEVTQAIESAGTEPGRELLADTRLRRGA